MISALKYAEEWRDFIERVDWGWFVFRYPRDTLLQHGKSMLNLFRHMQGLHYFGLFFYPAVPALCLVAWRRAQNMGIVWSWFVAAYLFMEFGPLEINFGNRPLITYGLIEKQPRYLTVLCAPAALLMGAWVQGITGRYQRYVAVLLFGLLFGNCIVCSGISSRFFCEHTADLRDALRFLNCLPQKKIYTDWLAIEQLSFYSGFAQGDYLDIERLARNPYAFESKNSYVLVGGAQGASVVADAFEKNYMQLFDHIPQHWLELKTIPGARDVFRRRDLKIYYVP